MAENGLVGSPLAGVQEDDDDISVTSTQEDEAVEDNIYNVHNIIDEQATVDGKKYYFIKWTGYPPSAWTWEPEENIETPEIVEAWEEEKNKILRGEASPFDHEWLKGQIAAETSAKQERYERREAKRRRIAAAASSASSKTKPLSCSSNNISLATSSVKGPKSILRTAHPSQSSQKPVQDSTAKHKRPQTLQNKRVSFDGSVSKDSSKVSPFSSINFWFICYTLQIDCKHKHY